VNKNDIKIKELLEVVKNKQSSMESFKRKTLVTNGIFHFSENEFFNINTIPKKDKLIKALAFLISLESNYNEACKRLNVEDDFLWYGYSVEDWQNDFAERIKLIDWTEKKKAIIDVKTKLDSLVSTEGKTEMTLDAITNQLLNI